MSQNDFTIVNQTFPNFRSDLNDALQALASLSSGPSAPSTTYPNMLWYDTGNNILKMRTEADDAWIDVGYLCQSTNKFCIFDDTNVVNSSGTQVGLIGDQPTSDWEAGTSTTESLVSPAKIRAATALSKEYQSTEQSLVSGGLITLAHGLGAEPKIISLTAVCKTGEAGFSVGDKIDISSTVYRGTSGAASNGASVYFDTLNIYLRIGADSAFAYVPNKVSGSSDSISTDNFNLIVRAFA